MAERQQACSRRGGVLYVIGPARSGVVVAGQSCGLQVGEADPARAAVTALLAFHALRPAEIRHLTLHDARDLESNRLYVPGRTIRLGAPVRVRLAVYLAHRTRRWPHTANLYFFVTRRTALSTAPVSRPWLYRHYPASSTLLRDDRILDEVQAADGDVKMICMMFGLSVHAASRYTAAGCSVARPPPRADPEPDQARAGQRKDPPRTRRARHAPYSQGPHGLVQKPHE
ncbi:MULTISPECIES: hypothetical protein [unclassified Streptomyces]|uniref:hypothetical protein n=1 Tax=unclassified Streptomyces TaxID=2593676 RepID=UPI00225B74B7|nr:MULTISPECIES: hypothetical protein [unclassified Streptomyces]MCX5063789.1 hypothetical protein [Streptomyces sp. NBC_00452]MCX5294153.1 hypothetical protein [Streptomyces sp. NBC_00183]